MALAAQLCASPRNACSTLSARSCDSSRLCCFEQHVLEIDGVPTQAGHAKSRGVAVAVVVDQLERAIAVAWMHALTRARPLGDLTRPLATVRTIAGLVESEVALVQELTILAPQAHGDSLTLEPTQQIAVAQHAIARQQSRTAADQQRLVRRLDGLDHQLRQRPRWSTARAGRATGRERPGLRFLADMNATVGKIAVELLQ